MSVRAHTLMEQSPVRRLQAAESVVLARVLSGHAGDRGLYLGMTREVAKGLPRMGHWVRLRLADDELQGAVRASAGELLPFADDAFRVVVLSHVLEWTPHAVGMLDEAIRVLAPDGLLVVTGFQPFSAWMPWLLCRRRPRPMLVPPGWVRQRLAKRSVQLLRVHRCGATLPTRHGGAVSTWLGGGFVLVAHKQQAAIMKLRPKALRQSAGRQSAWVPGTHSECA